MVIMRLLLVTLALSGCNQKSEDKISSQPVKKEENVQLVSPKGEEVPVPQPGAPAEPLGRPVVEIKSPVVPVLSGPVIPVSSVELPVYVGIPRFSGGGGNGRRRCKVEECPGFVQVDSACEGFVQLDEPCEGFVEK